jgi:hypothetical protein
MLVAKSGAVLNTKGIEGNFIILLGTAVSLAQGKYDDNQLLYILKEMQQQDYTHMLKTLDKYFSNELTIIT